MPNEASVRQKIEIVLGWSRGESARAIAEYVKLGKSAVCHWIKERKRGGDMETKPRSGRPPALSSRAKFFAHRALPRPGFGSLAKVAAALRDKGYTPEVVSTSTLSRMLKEPAMKAAGRLVADRSRPKPALSKLDKDRRSQFAGNHTETDWDQVMFTDRKRFYFRYPGCSVPRVQWHKQGEKRVATKPSSPLCVNVYMGITRYGPTEPVFITGTSRQPHTYFTKGGKPARNVTSKEYSYVLKHHLLPQGQKLMSAHHHHTWYFQQDNDPAHKDAVNTIAQYNSSRGTSIRLLANWPPHSPDLNLIENVWGAVQSNLDELGSKTFTQFKSNLIKLLASVPQESLVNAFKGMPKRVNDVISLKGDRLKH